MNEFVQVFGPARMLAVEQILCAILASFVLSLAVAAVYKWTYQSLSYSRSFVHTQVLVAVVTCIVIMAIGNNLARGLGILGTLALIRFRTQVRDPRDIIFLFACMAIGISCGAAVFPVAVIGTLSFCIIALYLHWSPFASIRLYEGLLRFSLPAKSESMHQVHDIFSRYCAKTVLVATREAVQGEAVEYSYQVRLIDPTYHSDLINALRDVKDAADVSLLMHRATVEI